MSTLKVSVWRGAESGEFRTYDVPRLESQTVWNGSCTLSGNSFARAAPINFWNLDKILEQTAPGSLKWAALTTGGFGGIDAWLADPRAGTLKIDTALVKTEIKLADISLNDLVFANGGIKRQLRVFRMPDENPRRRARRERKLALTDSGDNALYVCVTQEDGNLIWSSPVHIFK